MEEEADDTQGGREDLEVGDVSRYGCGGGGEFGGRQACEGQVVNMKG